jgi:hypothetical protein
LGDDRLVSVRRARWGECLGTVEGEDDWEVRDVRGPSLMARRRGAAQQAQDAAADAASRDSAAPVPAPSPAKDCKNDGDEELSAFLD